MFYKGISCVGIPSVEAMLSIGRWFGQLLPLYTYLGIRVKRVDKIYCFYAFIENWAEMNLLQVHNNVIV